MSKVIYSDNRYGLAERRRAVKAKMKREGRTEPNTEIERRILDGTIGDDIEIRTGQGQGPTTALTEAARQATVSRLQRMIADPNTTSAKRDVLKREVRKYEAVTTTKATNNAAADRRAADKALKHVSLASAAKWLADDDGQRSAPKLNTAVAHVTRDEPIYSPNRKSSFFRDIAARDMGDMGARDRLLRHTMAQREQRVDGVATVAAGGFASHVVPQYLREAVDQLPRQPKVLWNLAQQLPLPAEGLNVTFENVSVGMAVGGQATENSAVASATYQAANDGPVPVRTFAGQAVVSWQALQRSAVSDVQLFVSLTREYDRQLESQTVNGDGNAPNHLGLLNLTGEHTVALTSTSYTSFRHAVLLGSRAISQSNEGDRADAIVMHSRRWDWLLDRSSADDTPVISDLASEPGPGGKVGSIAGIPVYVTDVIPTNISTNQDAAFVVVRSHLAAMDSGIQELRWQRQAHASAASGAGHVVSHGYSVFRARRPGAVAVIGGSGLSAVLS